MQAPDRAFERHPGPLAHRGGQGGHPQGLLQPGGNPGFREAAVRPRGPQPGLGLQSRGAARHPSRRAGRRAQAHADHQQPCGQRHEVHACGRGDLGGLARPGHPPGRVAPGLQGGRHGRRHRRRQARSRIRGILPDRRLLCAPAAGRGAGPAHRQAPGGPDERFALPREQHRRWHGILCEPALRTGRPRYRSGCRAQGGPQDRPARSGRPGGGGRVGEPHRHGAHA